jgi:type II secretory pathway pseudopilin PulG
MKVQGSRYQVREVMANMEQVTKNGERRKGEQGFMLLGLIVTIALILLALGVAAADMAFTVRAERERESVRRANQYVRAIRLFYLKNQHYPGSMKQLENTNMVRYLRQQYTDPLTGKEYRLIGVGQNKTTVKGFFGQPLGGIAGSGLGALAGSQSAGMPGSPATPTAGTLGTNGTPGTIGATSGTGAGLGTGASTSPFGSSMGSGSSGPFMGVGSNAKGDSIIVVNGQTTYETWEFLYDPRIEQLKAAAALNSGVGTMGPGGLGQTPGANNTTNPTSIFNPTSPGSNPTSPGSGTPPAGGTSPTGP